MNDISPKVKQVIEENITLLEKGDFEDLVLLFECCDAELTCKQQDEFVEVLKQAGIKIDPARETAFLRQFKNNVQYYINNPDPQDKSNSWSRFSYILDNMSWLGYSYDELVKLVKAHEGELGVHLTPLPMDYMWNSNEEYDIGWFNPQFWRGED